MSKNKKRRLNLRGKIVVGCAAVLFLLFVGWLISRFGGGNIEIQMNGAPSMELAYGSDHYTEEGATAVFRGKLFSSHVKVPVTVEGAPEYYAAPGTYLVTYQAKYRHFTGEATRTVIIRDLTPPQLVLSNDTDQSQLPLSYYAYDDVDGDLTSKVITRDGGDGFMYYTVSDASGNTTEIKREILNHDTTAPVITLNGAEKMTLSIGETFEDPGATATDDTEGEISERIKVSGEVDTAIEGVYTLTYTVSDKFGNETSVIRDVTVRSALPTPPGAGKIVYLTFDDGPGPYTADLLDLLAKYNIRVTFFVTNQRPEYRHMIAREYAEGHSIGIHSATHSYDIYASEDAFWNDMNTMTNIIIEQTGKKPELIRFIGGSSTTKANNNPGIISRLAAQIEARGYAYFDWNVSSGDGNFSIATEDAYNFVIEGISKRESSVVLMHDLNKNSMAAVEDIIKWGLGNGYTFLPLSKNSPTCHHRISN